MDQLLEKAMAAGKAAGDAIVPRPMVVSGGGKEYFVEDGVCGFAHINIKPANCAFTKMLKNSGMQCVHKAYGGGINFSVWDYNQSMQRKEAYAEAFAAVLREEGINARAESRMD